MEAPFLVAPFVVVGRAAAAAVYLDRRVLPRPLPHLRSRVEGGGSLLPVSGGAVIFLV